MGGALLLLAAGSARADPAPAEQPAPVGQVETRARRVEAADEAASREEISREELRELRAPTLLETLSRRVPWMHATGDGSGLHGIAAGSTGALRLRGLGGQPTTQVLVVWDGVPDFHGVFGHPLPDLYVGALLESVEVISGGAGVRWGTNAGGGALVLRSRWRDAPGWELDASAGAGQLGTHRAQAAALGRAGPWQLALAATTRRTDGARQGAGGATHSAQAAARLTHGRGALTVRARHGQLEGRDPGPLSAPRRGAWYRARRSVLSTQWGTGQERWAARALLFGAIGRNLIADGFEARDLHLGARLEAAARPGRWLELMGGLAADRLDGRVLQRAEGRELPVEPVTTAAPWTQATLRPLESVALVAGGRWLFGLREGGEPLYVLGASWWAWPGGRVRARLSRDVRQPTIRERYLPLPVANPSLRPERSRTAEIGVEQYVGRKLEVRLTGFQTRAMDLIRAFGVFPYAELVNVDDVRFWGAEGLVIHRPLQALELGAGGGWTQVGRYTALSPAGRAAAWVRWSQESLRASLTGSWAGPRYARNYQREPMPPLLDVSARAGWRPIPRAEIFGEAYNLLDRSNPALPGYPSAGRRLFVGLRVQLEHDPEAPPHEQLGSSSSPIMSPTSPASSRTGRSIHGGLLR